MNRFEVASILREFVKTIDGKKIPTEKEIDGFVEQYCEDNNIEADTKPKKFRKIANELSDLYSKKNNDYGDSFGQTFRKLGIISAVTRISDKYNRLVSLATGKKQMVQDEKIDDTLRDLASYAIMTVLEIQEEKKDGKDR